MGLINAFLTLFINNHKFVGHRAIGLAFLLQYAAEIYLFFKDYDHWLRSPLVWSVPLTGLCQAINAALTFKFLPRTEIPGFAATADKSMLSYYTVVENSFYALQLLFVCCYLHDRYRPWIRCLYVVEPFFVFFIFWARDLWPSSRMGKAVDAADKKMSAQNRLKLTLSTYAIKIFYILAKHFVYFLPNYLIFLDRVTPVEQRLLYAVQVLGAYATTISIFIHTLKFKGYIGPITAMVAYDIIIPGFLFLYWRMFSVIIANADLAAICALGLLLNLVSKRLFHAYQALVAIAFYGGLVQKTPAFAPLTYQQGALAFSCLVLSIVALILMFPNRPKVEATNGNGAKKQEATNGNGAGKEVTNGNGIHKEAVDENGVGIEASKKGA